MMGIVLSLFEDIRHIGGCLAKSCMDKIVSRVDSYQVRSKMLLNFGSKYDPKWVSKGGYNISIHIYIYTK